MELCRPEVLPPPISLVLTLTSLPDGREWPWTLVPGLSLVGTLISEGLVIEVLLYFLGFHSVRKRSQRWYHGVCFERLDNEVTVSRELVWGCGAEKCWSRLLRYHDLLEATSEARRLSCSRSVFWRHTCERLKFPGKLACREKPQQSSITHKKLSKKVQNFENYLKFAVLLVVVEYFLITLILFSVFVL